jgi:hypothetical protein
MRLIRSGLLSRRMLRRRIGGESGDIWRDVGDAGECGATRSGALKDTFMIRDKVVGIEDQGARWIDDFTI